MKNFKFPKINTVMALFILAVLPFTSCDDEPILTIDQELITTVQLKFTEVSSNAVTTFEFADVDGPGGNPPVMETIQLMANTSYKLQVSFLDESDSVATDDITAAVQASSSQHLVCYVATGEMTEPVITDTDSSGKPLGLRSDVNTGNAGTGTLKVSLKHMADKAAASPCGTGETDVEVTFAVTIN